MKSEPTPAEKKSKTSVSTAELQDQLVTMTEPLIVEFTNPALSKYIKSAKGTRRIPFFYVGNQIIFYPKIEDRNQCKSLEVFDLVSNKKTSLEILLSDNYLYDLFITPKHDIITVGSNGVTVWRIEKKDETISLIHKKYIMLPTEITQHFVNMNFQYTIKKHISIQMFPEGNHIGILIRDADFYLVDCENANYKKFRLGVDELKSINKTLGFIPISSTEIYTPLVPPGTYPRQWYKVNFNNVEDKAIINSKPLLINFQLMFDDDLNYKCFSLDRFLIIDQIGYADTHSIEFSLHDDKSNDTYIVGIKLQYFPLAKTLCVANSNYTHELRFLLPEEYQLDSQIHTRLIQKTWPIKNIQNLIPCGDRAMLIWDGSTIKACILPLVKKDKELIDVIKILMPYSGTTTHVGLSRIISSYLENPCPFLTFQKPKEVNIKQFTSFEPTPHPPQPDFSALRTLRDVAECLEYTLKKTVDENANVSLCDSITALNCLKEALSYIIEPLNSYSTEEEFKKLFTIERASWYREVRKDETLFRDPNSFVTDLMRILNRSIDDESSGCSQYMKETVIPSILEKFHVKELLQIADEIVQKMIINKKDLSQSPNFFRDSKEELPAQDMIQGQQQNHTKKPGPGT